MSDSYSVAIPTGGIFTALVTVWSIYSGMVKLAMVSVLAIAFMAVGSAFAVSIKSNQE